MIFIYVGLPGSGKTYHSLKHAGGRKGCLVFDDVEPEHLDNIKSLKRENLYFNSPHFCDEKILRVFITYLRLLFPVEKIFIEYFKNDPIACKQNVLSREDGRCVQASIDLLSKIYRPPPKHESSYFREDFFNVWVDSVDIPVYNLS